ncbi:hypothetical protein PBI_QYRZULA_64 [Mycobacterium phage Qyrzula]|uniref:Uncharacterized protein n=1 Tax=Mycobacterium phage Qyrzula TaxID=373414 RepID=Q19Z22_9CAUD|nr:gp64 [Mycobacterium phage Qyrzula]ABE67474.1 hypothetical protein PBI_QYRZULA_64 [Mycobacterium phage Qyrzula]
MATMSKPRIEAQRGTSRHGPSIKAPRMYEALRRKGYSKEKAARISNAAANGTLDRSRRGKKGGRGKFALASAGSRVRHGAGGNRRGSGGRAKASTRGAVRGGNRRGNASRATGRAMTRRRR